MQTDTNSCFNYVWKLPWKQATPQLQRVSFSEQLFEPFWFHLYFGPLYMESPLLQSSQNTPDRMDFFAPPQQQFHMRHLIMNKWENNLCHIKLYCFRFAIFMRPSWSPADVFCSWSGASVAPVDWQPSRNPQKLYWMSDRWVSKQNAGLLILVKWSNCF